KSFASILLSHIESPNRRFTLGSGEVETATAGRGDNSTCSTVDHTRWLQRFQIFFELKCGSVKDERFRLRKKVLRLQQLFRIICRNVNVNVRMYCITYCCMSFEG
ncbi:unnamed protein product, partial [Pylaiella littoralis]